MSENAPVALKQCPFHRTKARAVEAETGVVSKPSWFGSVVSSYHEHRVLASLRLDAYLIAKVVKHAGPTGKIPFVGYFVNDAAIARQVMRQSADFGLTGAGGFGTWISRIWPENSTLLNSDNEIHAELRSMVEHSFRNRSLEDLLEKLDARLQTSVTEPLQRGEEIDLVEVMRHTSLAITLDLLGVVDYDDVFLDRTYFTCRDLLGEIPLGRLDISERRLLRVRKLQSELKALINQVKQSAQPDSLTQTICDRLDDESASAMISMFLVAGSLTVVASAPRIVASLIDSKQFHLARSGSHEASQLVEEGLRYVAPGPIALYGVKCNVTVEGRKFSPGLPVFVMLHNALHNHRYLDRPSQLRVGRKLEAPIKGLWFGQGEHLCIGDRLAKRELAAVIDSLAAVGRDVKVVARKYETRGIFPGYKTLKLRATSIR